MPRAAASLPAGPAPLTAAILHLEQTERALEAQLGAARAARQALEAIAGQPAAPPNVQPERRAPAPDRRAAPRGGRRVNDAVASPRWSLDEAALRAYLRARGPVQPADLWAHFKLPKHVARQLLKAFAKRGVITITGSTTTRRIALAGASPAKEAP